MSPAAPSTQLLAARHVLRSAKVDAARRTGFAQRIG